MAIHVLSNRSPRLILALVLLVSAFFVLAPIPSAHAATPIFVRTDGNDVECDGTANVAYPGGTGPLACGVQTIQQGVSLVDSDGVVNVAAGTYTLAGAVTVGTANVTLAGAGTGSTIVQVSGSGERIYLTANGVTLQGFEIVKTDKPGVQNIIYVGASNVTIQNNLIHGQYVFGDGDVSRAMVMTGGLTGLLIDNNTIHSLRQPAYVSGPTTGIVSNNTVSGTRGWVLEQGDLTFSNNQWGSGNTFDIAILGTVNPIYYTDIVAMSNANNEAVIEDQRAAPAVLSVVYVDDSAAPGGNGGQIQPYQTLAPALPRVVTGGTINVAAGTYAETVSIDKALTLQCAQAGNSVSGRTAGSGGETIIDASGLPTAITIKASSVTMDGCDIVGNASTYAGVMVYATTGSGNLSNITVKNNFVYGMALPNPSSTAYVTSYGIFGLGDAVSGVRRTLTGLAIQGNSIYNLGGVVSGPDTSAGAGVWLYGVQGASAGLGASITGNTFDDIFPGLDGGVPEPGVGVAVLDDGDATPDKGASVAGNTYSDTYGGVVMFAGVSAVNEAAASFTNVPMLVLNVGNLATVNEATLAKYAKTDKPTGYPFSTAYFAQIGEAVKQSDAGANVTVTAGTFNESQVLIDKAMTVQGAGSASTILDGGSVVGLPSAGLVRIVATGNVTFDGFTVKKAGDSGANFVRVGIYASAPSAGGTYTISHNKILGSNNPLDDQDYGFYSNGGQESLVFTYNEITQTGANAILLEQHTGPTDVSYNTFDRGVADGANDAYFNMNYGGADITSLQKASHNTIDVGTGTVFDNAHRSFGITFVGDFTTAGLAGGFTNVQITDNTIVNLKAYRRGIGFWNNGPGSGASGNISNALISGNTITGVAGNTGSMGIRLLGLSTGANVTDNDIDNVDMVFRGQAWNGHIATGATVNQNNFSNSATGFDWQGAALLNAETNWWGSPCGPSGAGPGNGIPVSAKVDFNPWWTTVNGPGTASYVGGEYIVPTGSTTPQIQAILDCAGPGSVVKFESGSYPGGLVVNNSGVTIKLNGCTIGHGTPAFTIVGNDVTISGPGALDGNGDPYPGILVQNAGNFTLQNAEVREWLDGIQVVGNVVSLKVTGNWIHANADAGLQVDGTPSGVITIKGNLFKENTGDGVVFGGTGLLTAAYNSWGDLGGPNVGVGDGANAAKVSFTPWTFVELFMDVNPPANAVTRNVVETTSFNVELKADAAKLYGMSFKITYDPAKLTLNSTTFASPWAGTCASLSATAGIIRYRCNLQTPTPEYGVVGGTIATFNFTALAGPPGNGPWPTYFDISHLEADTSAGAIGGVKVFVNSAGFGAPSSPARNIADIAGDDGEIKIIGLANFTGFVDLEGDNNDGGAILTVLNQKPKVGSVPLASGTSVASGAYTTSHITPNWLLVGSSYWFQFDAPLHLPTTTVIGSVTYPSVPTDWTNGALLTTRPTTPLAFATLLGGDATNNDVVDIFDAGCIGANYENPSFSTCGVVPGTSPDVVVDGTVNIFDLVLMGSNYELTYSPWSQLPPP